MEQPLTVPGVAAWAVVACLGRCGSEVLGSCVTKTKANAHFCVIVHVKFTCHIRHDLDNSYCIVHIKSYMSQVWNAWNGVVVACCSAEWLPYLGRSHTGCNYLVADAEVCTVVRCSMC